MIERNVKEGTLVCAYNPATLEASIWAGQDRIATFQDPKKLTNQVLIPVNSIGIVIDATNHEQYGKVEILWYSGIRTWCTKFVIKNIEG